jgi:hypothetical protein
MVHELRHKIKAEYHDEKKDQVIYERQSMEMRAVSEWDDGAQKSGARRLRLVLS